MKKISFWPASSMRIPGIRLHNPVKPYLSIIIPYHNSAETIGRLLTSLAHSKNAPLFEVIVVDDRSDEEFTVHSSQFTVKTIKRKTNNLSRRQAGFELRTIRLATNKGPAAARNKGAVSARGKFIVFLDSDVEVFPDTLKNLASIYQNDPDVVAVTGVWTKEQRSRAFFPNFKALRDWSYWINERDVGGYYFLFSTRIASIKKSVFGRLGGFDESYPAALVEDIELTYRIARRYAIIFAPNVRVRHQFEGFLPIAKKYFWRSYYWIKLYGSRKKFDPVATTGKEAAAAISAAALVALLPLRIASFLLLPHTFMCFFVPGFSLYVCFGSIFQWLLVSIFLTHLFLVRKFLWFVYKEKGIVFAVKSFFVGIVLYCFIFIGALFGRFKAWVEPKK